MRLRIVQIAAVLTVFGCVLAGCGSIVDPANNQTQTFTGTLGTGGASAQALTVSKSGEYSVTFVSLSPAPQATAFFTIFLGQNTSQGCAPVSSQTNVFSQPGKVVLNSSIVPAAYCIAIADSNNAIATSAIYTLTVQYP